MTTLDSSFQFINEAYRTAPLPIWLNPERWTISQPRIYHILLSPNLAQR
jgi:hypothetical protein